MIHCCMTWLYAQNLNVQTYFIKNPLNINIFTSIRQRCYFVYLLRPVGTTRIRCKTFCLLFEPLHGSQLRKISDLSFGHLLLKRETLGFSPIWCIQCNFGFWLPHNIAAAWSLVRSYIGGKKLYTHFQTGIVHLTFHSILKTGKILQSQMCVHVVCTVTSKAKMNIFEKKIFKKCQEILI